MGSPLDALRTAPEAVTRAETLLTQVDACLSMGLGRLGAEQLSALDSLARSLQGTPLGAPLADAIKALRRSEFSERALLSLAAARGALQGAMHDALLAQASQALGRPAPLSAPPLDTEVQELASHQVTYLESARQWLVELALAGFARLGPEALLPFAATLEKLQGEPRLVRQSSLLTGLYQELVSSLPIDGMGALPLYRWADLWSRAMLVCVRAPLPAKEEAASGELRVLGTVLRHHPNFVSVVAYGVLGAGDSARWVRASLASYKVDVLTGAEVWRLFASSAPNLLKAITERASLSLKAMPLSSAHDFLWEDKKASAGAVIDSVAEVRAFALGGKAALRAPLAAFDRHPVQLAEPVFVEGAALQKGDGTRGPALVLEGASLPLLTRRMSQAAEPTEEQVSGATGVFGLLRYDAGAWGLEPLLAFGKGKKDIFHTGREASKYKSDSLAVLQERASRLLRAKS